jgi:polysaccharide pyruvyl transferase WcaK-like protein
VSLGATVLVANETGHTSNPGCRAVRRGIDRLFALAGVRRVGELPLGLWADAFDGLAPPRDLLVQRSDGLRRGTLDAPPFDLEAWRRIRERLAGDRRTAAAIDSAGMLVVNGEGSLHHNMPRALALMALIDIAAERDRPVALVNATIQAMADDLLATVLPQVAFAHLREERSLALVRPHLKTAIVAPDLAVLALRVLATPARTRSVEDGQTCLVTCGVLIDEALLRATIAAVKSCGLQPIYLSMGDGGETSLSDRVCAQEAVEVLHAGRIDLERLMALLSRCAVAVSGRHHMNLFLMRCGVPFVPLPSNTWKIQATLDLLGYPVPEIEGTGDLPAVLTAVHADRAALSQAARDAFGKGSSLCDEVPERFRRWIS